METVNTLSHTETRQLDLAIDPIDDWSGISDPQTRRRLQNRLNARASRKRKANPARKAESVQLAGRRVESHNESEITERHLELVQLFLNRYWSLESPDSTSQYLVLSAGNPRYQKLIGDSIARAAFPLSSDHLIPLVQYNILRAVCTLSALVGIPWPLDEECYELLDPVPLFPMPAELPESLAPTDLQLTKTHEPWIDLLPDPTMRDNSIAAQGRFKYDDFERDCTGGFCLGLDTAKVTGMIVWTDPWRPEGWEMSENFVRNWGFLVKGCTRLFESTNRWREQRGEEPLVMEV